MNIYGEIEFEIEPNTLRCVVAIICIAVIASIIWKPYILELQYKYKQKFKKKMKKNENK